MRTGKELQKRKLYIKKVRYPNSPGGNPVRIAYNSVIFEPGPPTLRTRILLLHLPVFHTNREFHCSLTASGSDLQCHRELHKTMRNFIKYRVVTRRPISRQRRKYEHAKQKGTARSVLYVVRAMPMARQRVAKHIPAEANERNNWTSVARQRRGIQALSTI